MIRSAMLALLLTGCAASTMPTSSSSQSTGAVDVPQPEVHRGLLTNQKSSPDAPSDSGSTGGRGGI